MKRELPQFTAKLRRARESEAFNQWIQAEASRELRNPPFSRNWPPAAGSKPP